VQKGANLAQASQSRLGESSRDTNSDSTRASRSSGEFLVLGNRPSCLDECASPKRELETVGSFCLSISLRREPLSWAKAHFAQARDHRLSENLMDDGFCLNSPPRLGTLVLGEGWTCPSEKELAQVRVRGLLLCNVLA